MVFWSERRGRYVQIGHDFFQQLITKGHLEIGYNFGKLLRFERNSPSNKLPSKDAPNVTAEQKARAEAWLQKYPWRNGAVTLKTLMHSREFEPNTRLWHALNVVMNYERFTSDLEETIRQGKIRRKDINGTLRDASEVSFVAGFSAATLLKKPLEYDAVALHEVKRKRAEASGKLSNRKRAARVASFMAEIEALAHLYPMMSEQRIVDQAFENAVAKAPDLWRQGKGQKDAYLSDDIRSKEPFKSRYYAIFGKTA